jgi:hypothetical protein
MAVFVPQKGTVSQAAENAVLDRYFLLAGLFAVGAGVNRFGRLVANPEVTQPWVSWSFGGVPKKRDYR